MTLNLISLATVKSELGLTDSTYDAQITALIPKVSSDVRRILNYNYDVRYSAAFDDSAGTIDIYTGEKAFFVQDYKPMKPGTVLYHPNIPADTYIVSYDPDTDLYTLSATPTGTGDYIYPTIDIAMWSTISKMIFWRISQTSTDAASERGVSAKSIGTVSVTYSDSEINKQWNYPQPLIDDLGVPYSRIG